MKILLVGAGGYIGSALAAQLAQGKDELFLLDKRKPVLPLLRPTAKVHRLSGNVALRKTWERVVPGMDVVFHLAAVENSDPGRDVEQEWQVNTLSVLHLLETCRREGHRPRIVFSSSANVYGQVKKVPVTERTLVNPPAIWSVHKYMAELYLRVYATEYGISSTSLRLANVYGPSTSLVATSHAVLNRVIQQALQRRELTLFSNKDAVRDFVFLPDVVAAFMAAAAQELSWNGSSWVIGSGQGFSFGALWKQIAAEVKRQAGYSVRIHEQPGTAVTKKEQRSFIADTSAFQQLTGWQAHTKPAAGIKQTVAWYIAQRTK